MSRGKTRARKPAESSDDESRDQYHGHDIVMRQDGTSRRVQIDDRAFRYGKIGNLFYLEDYAYEPDESLAEVVHRFIDYRDASERDAAARETGNAGS